MYENSALKKPNHYDIIIRMQEVGAQLEDAKLYVKLGLVETGSKNALDVSVIYQKIEVVGNTFFLTPVFQSSPETPCLICLAEPGNLVCLPCGHLCLGDLCIKTYFEKNDNRACPVCRKEVTELVSVQDTGLDYEKATIGREELERREQQGDEKMLPGNRLPAMKEGNRLNPSKKNKGSIFGSVVNSENPFTMTNRKLLISGDGHQEGQVDFEKSEKQSEIREKPIRKVKLDLESLDFGKIRNRAVVTYDEREERDFEETGLGQKKKSEPELKTRRPVQKKP